jgi:hypothetical protein
MIRDLFQFSQALFDGTDVCGKATEFYQARLHVTSMCKFASQQVFFVSQQVFFVSFMLVADLVALVGSGRIWSSNRRAPRINETILFMF